MTKTIYDSPKTLYENKWKFLALGTSIKPTIRNWSLKEMVPWSCKIETVLLRSSTIVSYWLQKPVEKMAIRLVSISCVSFYGIFRDLINSPLDFQNKLYISLDNKKYVLDLEAVFTDKSFLLKRDLWYGDKCYKMDLSYNIKATGRYLTT